MVWLVQDLCVANDWCWQVLGVVLLSGFTVY